MKILHQAMKACASASFILVSSVLPGCGSPLTGDTSEKTLSDTAPANTRFDPRKHTWPHDASDLAPDPRVRFGQLENGLRYAVLPAGEQNDVVSIQVSIDAGFNNEIPSKYGVAHLLEHLVFRGTKDDEGRSVIHDFQSSGAGFGSDLNGFTTLNETFYRVNLSNPNQRDVAQALQNFETMLSQPDFSEEAIAAEKGIVLAEREQRNTVNRRATLNKISFQFPDKVRYSGPTLGTPETIDAIDPSDLIAFHDNYYRPENTLIVIAGDIHANRTTGEIKKLFGHWQKTEANDEDFAFEGPLDANALSNFPRFGQFFDNDLLTSMLAVENAPSSRDYDSIDFRKREMLTRIVNSILSERLRSAVDEDDNTAWINVNIAYDPAYDLKTVTFGAKRLAYDRAMEIFETERLRAVKYGFAESELLRALKKEQSRLKRRISNDNSIISWSEANRLRNSYQASSVYTSANYDLQLFEIFTEALDPSDYNQHAKLLWAEFTPRLWIQSSKGANETLEEVDAVIGRVSEKDISPPDKSADLAFNYAEPSEEGKVIDRDHLRGPNLHRLLWSNGARLNYISDPDMFDKVAIHVRLKGDVSLYKDNYASFSEWVSTVSKADITSISKSDMDKIFAGQDVAFNAALDGEDVHIRISTNPDDVLDALKVVTTFFLTYNPESSSQRQRYSGLLTRQKANSKVSPVVAGIQELPYFWAAESSVFQARITGKSDLAESFKEVLPALFADSSIEVGVVGDFIPDLIEDAFAKTLASLPPRRGVTADQSLKNFEIDIAEPGESTFFYDGPEDQMALFYCWPFNFRKDERTTEAAYNQIAQDIFKNRVEERLRRKLGLTYSTTPFTYVAPIFEGMSYSCLALQIASDNEVQVKDNMAAILEGLQEGLTDKDEFERSRKPALSLWERLRPNESLNAMYIASAYSDPQQFDQFRKITRSIESINFRKMQTYIGAALSPDSMRIFRVQKTESQDDLDRRLLTIEADRGDAESQYDLGTFLLQSVRDGDQEEGRLWIEKSAAQGFEPAFVVLGNFAYEEGETEQAVRLLKQGQREIEAKLLLADIFFRNPDLFPDVTNEEIFELYRNAAEGGLREAQRVLAQRYREGAMIKRDEVEALKWMFLAKGSHDSAIMDVVSAKYAENLTDVEVEEARARARRWALRGRRTDEIEARPTHD